MKTFDSKRRSDIYSPLVHGRVVDAQTAENCKCFKYWNFAIRKLGAIGMHINQNPDNPLLAVHNRHAQNALRPVRNVLAITMVLGIIFEPIGGVVDVQNFAGLGDVLSDLSKNRAVNLLDGRTVDVGHAFAPLLRATKRKKRKCLIIVIKTLLRRLPFRKSGWISTARKEPGWKSKWLLTRYHQLPLSSLVYLLRLIVSAFIAFIIINLIRWLNHSLQMTLKNGRRKRWASDRECR